MKAPLRDRSLAVTARKRGSAEGGLRAGRMRVIGLILLVGAECLAAPSPAGSKQRIEKIESCVLPAVVAKDDPSPCQSLTKEMAELHVPGVSIAVVHNGVLEWARGYGVKRGGGDPVTPETLFQAGSISKPVAALAALRLVQEGKLSLDSDVNAKLSSWKIPANPGMPGAVVTLRELLTHTAGFTVHGFPGYAAGAPVPTLIQVLNGERPANTPPIRLESVPGSKWNYSGGGYTVMQQLMLDVTREPFPNVLRETVLVPSGMTHSTYQQPLPAAQLAMAAIPYTHEGSAVTGGPHTYPEMAAAGLWTTPSDVADYIIEVQQSLQGRANHVLSQDLPRQMLIAGKGNWGLGVQIGGSSAKPYFSHGGVNEGYESLFVAYENEGEGAVVMTNAEGGSRLAAEVMRGIAAAYDWPDYHPAVRTQIRLEAASLARFAGTYELAPEFRITFSVEDSKSDLKGRFASPAGLRPRRFI